MNLNQIGASAGYTFAYYSLESTLERFLWSIDRLSELGYKSYSLEILEPQHVALYRERGAIEQLLERSKCRAVSFSSFIPYHCCTNLTSTRKDRRQLGLRQFEEGVEIARDLGISVVTIASDWPPEWVSSYSPEYAHAPAADFDVPSSEDYDRLWSDYIAAISQCVEISAKHGMRFGLEPRANCLVSTADSFLRLWDRLRSNEFFCVLDVMHSAYQRESIPVAIKKLGARLGILQMCGSDAETLNHLPLKDDAATRKILAALEETGFAGIIDVELYGIPATTIDESYRQAREILQHQMASFARARSA
jgi:sugar phosphate isomerase/epimerase